MFRTNCTELRSQVRLKVIRTTSFTTICQRSISYYAKCWGRAFGATQRVAAVSPTSQAFSSWHFHSLKRSICQVLQGSIRVGGFQVEAANNMRNEGLWDSACGGLMLMTEPRLRHGRLNMAAPHWSVEK
jgi:hypothetical protein